MSILRISPQILLFFSILNYSDCVRDFQVPNLHYEKEKGKCSGVITHGHQALCLQVGSNAFFQISYQFDAAQQYSPASNSYQKMLTCEVSWENKVY